MIKLLVAPLVALAGYCGYNPQALQDTYGRTSFYEIACDKLNGQVAYTSAGNAYCGQGNRIYPIDQWQVDVCYWIFVQEELLPDTAHYCQIASTTGNKWVPGTNTPVNF